MESAPQPMLQVHPYIENKVSETISWLVCLLSLASDGFVTHLVENIVGHLNEQLEHSLAHLPFVNKESWGHSQELLEVRLAEGSSEATLNHVLHHFKGDSPLLVSRSMQLKVRLELLEKLDQVIQVVR